MAIPDALADRLKNCGNLPSIPAVMMQVLDLCQNEDSSLLQVVAVVRKDPALSAKLLRLASTAIYSHSPVTNVERAVCLLGINATMCAALSFSVAHGLKNAAKPTGFDHHVFWRQAVTTAVCAREIGRQRGLKLVADLFVAGLLQDFGMMVLAAALRTEYDALVMRAGDDHGALQVLEKESLGATHAEVGAWILESWKLPAHLCRGVEASHVPDLYRATPDAEFVRICAQAAQVGVLWAEKGAALARGFDPKKLNMTRPVFDQFLASASAEIATETANLDIRLDGDDAAQLLERARQTLVMLSLRANQRAHEAEGRAVIDPLTGIHNRQYLMQSLDVTFQHARDQSSALSVIFVDIDHFKSVNDRFGHLAGDTVLASVAQTLRQTARDGDVVARYGGEEFVVLLPGARAPAAAKVAERLRLAVAANPVAVEGGLLAVTASLGVATFEHDNFVNTHALLECADRSLYAAKHAGRNRVVSAS